MHKKIVNNGYIITIGDEGIDGIDISENEYDAIFDALLSVPTAENGYDYMLKDKTLEWELVALPQKDEEETVFDKAEAYDILLEVKS